MQKNRQLKNPIIDPIRVENWFSKAQSAKLNTDKPFLRPAQNMTVPGL